MTWRLDLNLFQRNEVLFKSGVLSVVKSGRAGLRWPVMKAALRRKSAPASGDVKVFAGLILLRMYLQMTS